MRSGPPALVLVLWLATSSGCGPGEPSSDGGESESSTTSTGESSESGVLETGATDELVPETETDTETETDSETGDELEGVLDGELPEDPCTITPGPSDDALCDGGPCPLTTDVLVWCENFGLGDEPVTVAPGNDGPRLLISDVWYLALSGGSGEVLPFPQGASFGFPRFAQDSAGELVVVAIVGDNWASASWPAGVHRLAPLEAPQWAREFGVAGDFNNNMHGIEVDPEGRLHVWAGPQPETWITRDESGVWTEQEDVASYVGGPRTLTLDGDPVNFRYVASQFYAEIDGEKVTLGTPQGSRSELIRVARRPKPSFGGIGPEYAAVTTHDTGTQIHWPGGELLLPEAAYMPELPCPPEHDPEVACEPSCMFDLTGVVEEGETRGRVAVARTADGMLWLAWIETHHVLEHNYTQVCPPGPDPCVCEPEVITDERTSRLRLLRYDFVGDPTEVLSMPFAGNYGSPRPKIVADAFADRLVISLIVEGLGPMQNERGFRVLELDTDAF